MSFFKTRSDYFKSLATKNKQIAHDQYITGDAGPKRKSFFRLNDEEELGAACVNWAHFPCMVHFGFAGKYSANENEVDKRILLNDLLFLMKAKNATDMNSIEEARDKAFEVMEEVISRMKEDFETDGYCSAFQNFDLSLLSFNEYGPIEATLYGWRLSFNDEQFPDNVSNYDASKWVEE